MTPTAHMPMTNESSPWIPFAMSRITDASSRLDGAVSVGHPPADHDNERHHARDASNHATTCVRCVVAANGKRGGGQAPAPLDGSNAIPPALLADATRIGDRQVLREVAREQ